MSELCLMASQGYATGIALHHQQNPSRAIKDCQALLSISGTKPEIILRSGYENIQPQQSEETWKSIIGLSESNRFVELDTKVRSLEMVDPQDNHIGSLLFSLGLDKRLKSYENILEFLVSYPSEVNKNAWDLSDLRALQALKTLWCQGSFGSSLIFPSCEFDAQKPFMDFVGDLVQSSKLTIHPNGQVFFTATGTEMKDLLSVAAEFYLSKDSVNWRTRSILVPNYERLNGSGVLGQIHGSSVKLHARTVAPIKSPDTIKTKTSPKRRNGKKVGRERDLYRKNYFHACESLISFMYNKNRQGKRAILSLKNSGPELPELLTKFSAGIAGTGIAVIFSVMCKVACGTAPLSSSKLFNTGFGFGLVWLSCSVNKLRDTIVYISKKAGKVGLKEDEMMRKVNKSINDILVRAATLMAVAILRIG